MIEKNNFEVTEGREFIKIRDPKTSVFIEFRADEPQSTRTGVEGDPAGLDAKKLLQLSRELVDFAYSEGFFEDADVKQRKRRAARRALGEALRNARESKGVSIRDVESATGIAKSIISRTEGGRANTTIDTINELAEFYGLRVDLVK